MCEAFLGCALKEITDGESYSLGTGHSVSITQLAEQILENLGLNSTKLKYTGFSWKGDVKKLIADSTKIKKHLDLKITPLKDALNHEISWFQQNIARII